MYLKMILIIETSMGYILSGVTIGGAAYFSFWWLFQI